MRTIAIDGPDLIVRGALELHVNDTGLTPRRLPAWTRSQIPDVFMDAMVSMPSGVRLAFATDSTAVELDVMITAFHWQGDAPQPVPFQLTTGGPSPTTVSVTTDQGHRFVLDRHDPSAVTFEPGEPVTLRFTGLGGSLVPCELWLSHGATVELRALRIDDDATITAPTEQRPRWIHHGSSISHCMEADQPTGVWPAVAAKHADVELFSLGFAGQCQLDQFVARTIRDLPAAAISLKLGINLVNADSMRERTFVPAVHGFLDTIRDGHPQTPLLIVSPIFCPSAEAHPGPTMMQANGTYDVVARPESLLPGSLTLQRIRVLLAELVQVRRDLGDTNLHYLDGLQLFGADDVADMPDLLHPNAAGYRRMGERFAALAFGSGGALAQRPADEIHR